MLNNYPTYLVHFNRNHDSRNGQFTYGDGDGDGITDDHEHYKKMKEDYRSSIKEARKEFRKVKRESHKNRLFQKPSTRSAATEIVDAYANKKSEELYNQYIEIKKYKAAMQGKEFNPKSLNRQTYFRELGLDPGILGIPYPTLNSYKTRNNKVTNKPKVTKNSRQFYFFGGGN